MRKTLWLLFCSVLVSFSSAKTVYTGDKIQGEPVINQLDVDDLASGKTYRFWFQSTANATSQHWYVPVVVIKGSKPGKKLGVQAVVHGDEVNGVRVVQRIISEVKPETLSGTVVVVPTANLTGLLANNRNWQHVTDGGYMTDFNRIWPGKENGDNAEKHAYLLFNKLWKGNVNAFVDLHTQSTGTAYPLFIYADYRNKTVKTMAELVPADQIKNDEGEKGTVETTFVEQGIPAITMEIGSPNSFQPELINRAVIGINNIMSHMNMTQSPITQTSKEEKTFVGKEMTSVRAEVSGFAEILVKLGDDVKKGQSIAIQRNAFGDVLKEYQAPESGRVLAIGTDPVRENRSLLVRILY